MVDKDGNIFIAGVFSENLDFGKGPMVPTGIATKSDDFIAKFDASGNILWNQSWGTNNFDESSGLSLHEGHVMLSGCADNYQKIFAAQFNTDDGTLLWNQVFGTATTSQNFFNQTCSRYHSLASDSSGAILMTGFFEDQVSFGGGDLKNKGARDGFLAKFKIP